MGVLAAAMAYVITAGPAIAGAPYPHYGKRVIDGTISDWNLDVDFYADMYRAGKTDKAVESKAYLRYDCNSNTLFVLVLGEPGVIGSHSDEVGGDVTSWVAINVQSNKVVNELAGNDGIPSDFAWVGEGFDGDLSHMLGFEASFSIMPGSYNILIHMQILDSLGQQTSATSGSPDSGPELELQCTVPVDVSTWGRVKSLYR
jgi:hypothetical protein